MAHKQMWLRRDLVDAGGRNRATRGRHWVGNDGPQTVDMVLPGCFQLHMLHIRCTSRGALPGANIALEVSCSLKKHMRFERTVSSCSYFRARMPSAIESDWDAIPLRSC